MGESLNPYAPPTAELEPEVESDGFTYQSTSSLNIALVSLLGASVLALVASCVSMAMQIELLQRASHGAVISMDEANANDQRVVLLSGIWLLSFVTTGVVWAIWQARTHENVRALGAYELEHGPHAWGWFFCPIANLWKPLAVLDELWAAAPSKANDSDSKPWLRPNPPSLIVTMWWLTFILGHLLSRVSDSMLEDKNDDIDALISGSEMLLCSWAALAVSGVFGAMYVYLLQKRVQARAAAQHA